MAILYGTQSNGETLPVLVDQYGNLIAKGIDGAPGEPGEPGPPGPPGVGELPPGATDGALLGWQDGELVWVTPPVPVVNTFRPIIWTGNGGIQSISGLGFSPSLVWIKSRNHNYFHNLYDTVRGAGNVISSNDGAAETYDNNTLTAFNSDGFELNNGAGVNDSGKIFVAWCWNGGDTTVTNNDGTIQSQNRSIGDFSIVRYSGTGVAATVGHGLSSAPKFIIVKSLNNAGYGWRVYHESIGPTKYLQLNKESASDSYPDWNNKAPTDKVINLGGNGSIWTTNASGTDYIAYCWAETPGASSFGQYPGTGSRFQVVTGFRPSFVIIKSLASGNWFMFDNARGAQQTLRANLADQEDQTGVIEFLDDGFQVLFALPGINQSNVSYIYAAFANAEDAAFARRQLRRQARQEKRQQNETQPR